MPRRFMPRPSPGRFFALLPLALAALPGHGGEVRYVFREGDNPWTFAQAHLIPGRVDALLQLNGIANPYRILPGTEIRVPIDWLFRGSRPVRVLATSGEVSVVDRRGRVREVASGDLIRRAQKLTTAPQAGATLEFADGSRAVVRENSEIRIDKNANVPLDTGRDIRLEVPRGKVENEVEKNRQPSGRFQIRTPSGVAAVRGTHFRLGLVERAMLAEVVEGKVAVHGRRGAAVPVGAGNGVVVQGGGASLPKPLLPAPRWGDETPLLVDALPFESPVAPVAGAAAYRTLLSAGNELAAYVSDQQTRQPLMRIADVPDGDYSLHLRAVDGQGLEGLDAVRAVTVNVRPAAPFSLAPTTDAQLTAERPLFRWADVGADARYRLQVADNPSFAPLLIDQGNVSRAEFEPAHSLPEGDYFWRVASISPTEGQGPFGSVGRFRRTPPMPGNPSHDSQAARLRWPAAAGARYHVQIGADAAMAAPTVDAEVDSNDIGIEDLSPGVYFVRVQTIGRSGLSSPWSTPQSFTVERQFDWRPLLLVVPLLFLI